LTWVKDPPRKDGYYWVLPEYDFHSQGPMVVEVNIYQEELDICLPGDDYLMSISGFAEAYAPIRFWSDCPIYPPKESQPWNNGSVSPSASVSTSESWSWSVSNSPSASPSPADEEESYAENVKEDEHGYGEVPEMREI
jgi:hypothetical protein